MYYKLNHYFIVIIKMLGLNKNKKNFDMWFLHKGDKTLRLNYDLNENSIVIDVGGYEGQWSSDIYSMYNCVIHILEPVSRLADKIEKRFAKNKKIFIHKFGLSNQTGDFIMNVRENCSSILPVYSIEQNSIHIVKALDFFTSEKIDNIDLIKINIEGAEYDLLDHLLDCGYIKKIKNIQVQFHDFVDNAEMRMKKIQTRLMETHVVTYQYRFVWENWQLKNGDDLKFKQSNL